LLQLRGEEDLRFDRIVGRSVLTRRMSALADLCVQLQDRLLPGGLLCLVQAIPRYAQRLYELVDWPDDEALQGKVRLAEEGIYGDITDPLVNWDETDLANGLQTAGMKKIQVKLESVSEQRFITAVQLDRWFTPDQSNHERGGYGQRLRETGLTENDIKRTELLFRRSLLEKQVPWHTTTAFIKAETNLP